MLPLHLFPNLLVFIIIGVALFLLVTALFQWLWNITMPDVFNLKTINYWQAFRLLLIAGLLFGCVKID